MGQFILGQFLVKIHKKKVTKPAFHLSELTDQPIAIVMRISLLIKTNHPHQSNPTVLCTTEMVFQQNFLEKAHFSAKNVWSGHSPAGQF